MLMSLSPDKRLTITRQTLTLKMVLSRADKIVIETLFKEKGWRGNRLIKEFPSKNLNKRTINHLIKKIEATGSHERRKGGGRPAAASTDTNVLAVADLIESQEDEPGTHKSQRKIAAGLNISQSRVV